MASHISVHFPCRHPWPTTEARTTTIVWGYKDPSRSKKPKSLRDELRQLKSGLRDVGKQAGSAALMAPIVLVASLLGGAIFVGATGAMLLTITSVAMTMAVALVGAFRIPVPVSRDLTDFVRALYGSGNGYLSAPHGWRTSPDHCFVRSPGQPRDFCAPLISSSPASRHTMASASRFWPKCSGLAYK